MNVFVTQDATNFREEFRGEFILPFQCLADFV